MATLELEARLDNLLVTAQAETAEIDLFAPIQEREECPICMIPLPLTDRDIGFMPCCGKSICIGCDYKHLMTEIKNRVPDHKKKCAFCCQHEPKNTIKALKKLMKNNNPDAFMAMSSHYKEGEGVLQSDTRSLEMRINAAELGLAGAFGQIAYNYMEGIAVEQNMTKAFEFLEVAAKKGSCVAHKYLATVHEKNGDIQKSIEHYKVIASAGYQQAMDKLMKAYTDKRVSKEDLTQTLRAFQASKNEIKSKDRDDARTAKDNGLW